MTSSRGATECCMCGDYGLSSELFKCKICQFRSQHRYCSNLYPNAVSYRICNWCLSPNEVSGDKTQNSSNSSSSYRNTSDIQDGPIKFKKKLIIRNENIDTGPSPKGKRGSLTKLQLIKKNPIKIQKSMDRSPSLAARERVTIDGGIEEKIRRTKSEETSNRGITRKVLKNRVRRYKLLDEVSS